MLRFSRTGLSLAYGRSPLTTAISMFTALKRVLGPWTTNHPKCTKVPKLFSGSAYFSSRVPKAFSEKWVENGGEISSGTTLDVRARYFFATDPSEPWVTKLFAKSVLVIHAGWIVHCVDEAFRVPIAEYILDDMFVPEPPYKLTNGFALPVYVPLCEPGEPTDTESTESGPTPIQTSDTPSTPTSIPRKRKREHAYFDSPSGSLVFSAFDKDGIPRRPRKQRKLRFDPSFSPKDGGSGRGPVQAAKLDWFRDRHNASRDDDELDEEHSQDRAADALRGYMNRMHSPNTPDKPLASKGLAETYRCPSVDEHIVISTHASLSVLSIDKPEKMPHVRTIDFTNLPPSTRRWRFPEADGKKSGDTIISVVKPTDKKVKTPKKISFADHARVCVYTVSPRRSASEDGVGTGPARRSLSDGAMDGPEVDGTIWMSRNEVKGSIDSTAETTTHLAPLIDSPKIIDCHAQALDEDQYENDTLTLTMEEVQTMRRRLLESAEKNGVDDGKLATLFELGKTFRGMTFHHVW